MPDDALQLVYHSVTVGILLYASCAWNGFVSAADSKRVDAFLRRSKRCVRRPTGTGRHSPVQQNSRQQPACFASTTATEATSPFYCPHETPSDEQTLLHYAVNAVNSPIYHSPLVQWHRNKKSY